VYYRGPHGKVCLNTMWLDSGCKDKGSGFPEIADDERLYYLNSLTIP